MSGWRLGQTTMPAAFSWITTQHHSSSNLSILPIHRPSNSLNAAMMHHPYLPGGITCELYSLQNVLGHAFHIDRITSMATTAFNSTPLAGGGGRPGGSDA